MVAKFFLKSLIGVFLSGCGLFSPGKVWLNQVHFRASEDINYDSPLTVHVVIAYKQEVLSDLLKMDSDAYFSKIDQIKLDNAGEIDVFSFDIIPGQKLDAPVTPTRVDGVGVVVFARYSSPGQHRLTIADDKEVTILLQKLNFKIQPTKEP